MPLLAGCVFEGRPRATSLNQAHSEAAMTNCIEGRIAIITGADCGIGQATAGGQKFTIDSGLSMNVGRGG